MQLHSAPAVQLWLLLLMLMLLFALSHLLRRQQQDKVSAAKLQLSTPGGVCAVQLQLILCMLLLLLLYLLFGSTTEAIAMHWSAPGGVILGIAWKSSSSSCRQC
jgi:uncharacterized BrkB/YihY/UPF0761 family membrane protein